jgi:hypothetical protein
MWRHTLIGTLSGVSAVIMLSLLEHRASSPQPTPPTVIDIHRPSPPIAPTNVPRSNPEAQRAILAALETPVTEINAKAMPFGDLLDYVREVTGANVVVEWGRLGLHDVDPSTPVELKLRNVPARVVLDAACAALTDDPERVLYIIEDHVVRVTASDSKYRFVTTRMYPLRDLIDREADRYLTKNGPAATQPEPNPLKGWVRPPIKRTDIEELAVTDIANLIRETIDPDSWVDNGGREGSLRYLLGRLVITQSPKAHQQIEELLAKLRAEP